MNENDEDLDLALALGSANYRVQTESNHVSGAGVNASLKVDMAFAASDPISELVWSPHKGLSLKCADSSLADKKPFLLWNLGPSSKVFSPSQSVRSLGAHDDVDIDDGILKLSSPMPKLETEPREKTGDIVEEIARHPSFVEMERTCKGKGHMEEDIEYNARGNDTTELDVATCSKPNAGKLSNDTDVQSLVGPDDKEASASGGTKRNKANILCSKLETFAENESCNPVVKEARRFSESSFPSSSNKEVCLYQEKGKEKASSNGAIYRRSANGDDEGSNESVESCNSVRFVSGDMKRRKSYQDPILSSKRMKRQGSHGSTSIIKPHSSFMQWISNMVKGLSNSYKEESSGLDLTLACLNDVQVKDDRENSACNRTHDSPKLSMGFQTMFQSLYCRGTRTTDTAAPIENYSVQDSKELIVPHETTPLIHPPKSFHSNDENTCKHIVVSNMQENPCTSKNITSQPTLPWVCSPDTAHNADAYKTNLAGNNATGNTEGCDGTAGNIVPRSPMATGDVLGKSKYLTSLWITRLSTKNPQLEKGDMNNQVANVIPGSQRNVVFSNDQNHSKCVDNSPEEHVYAYSKEIQVLSINPEVSSDGKPPHKLKPTQPTLEFGRNSEAIASVFARRLDALKHVKSTKRETNLTCLSRCFFCGEHNHDLRECPEVTETEIEELIDKVSSNDAIKESYCLCIRCYQFDHWAISCPSGSSSKHGRGEQNVAAISPRKITISCSDNQFKENQSKRFSYHSTVTSKIVNAPADIWLAVRKLRISRVDILRWKNSDITFSHLNGFFLRLRLGKLESGLGGTGYCVACIIGDTLENIACRSKKSLLVDVGGVKSSVGCQYISNDDFLEEEIKAWWCRILKTGCKIPSLDELNSRFGQRTSLGF